MKRKAKTISNKPPSHNPESISSTTFLFDHASQASHVPSIMSGNGVIASGLMSRFM